MNLVRLVYKMVTWQEDKDYFKKLFTGRLNYRIFFDNISYIVFLFFFTFLFYYIIDVLKFSFSYFDDSFFLVTKIILLLSVMYVLVGLFSLKSENPKFEYFSLLFVSVVLFAVETFPLWLRFTLFGILMIAMLPEFYYNWEKNKPKTSVLITIFAMALVFLIGLMFIQNFYGAEDDTLFMNGCNNMTQGQKIAIDCNSLEGSWLIWESETNCNFLEEQNITNITGGISFKFLNGSISEKQFFKEDIQFIPPTLSKIAYFNLEGIKDNETYCYNSIWNNLDFISYKDYKEKKEKFFLYFIGLLGIIFITIPAGIKGIMDLSKEDKLEKESKISQKVSRMEKEIELKNSRVIKKIDKLKSKVKRNKILLFSLIKQNKVLQNSINKIQKILNNSKKKK